MTKRTNRRTVSAVWVLLLALAVTGHAAAVPKPTPHDVAEILSKLRGNSPLTSNEVTRLTAFYGGASAVSTERLSVARPVKEADAPITFEPNPFVQLAAVKAPTQDAYVALVQDVKDLYGAVLPDDGRAQLDSILSEATRVGYGADLGLLLLMQQAAPAAVYSTATEALKHPTDALTANNLGVALKGLHEYPRALSVLLYARQLAPSLTLPVTNLGYVQALMGDTATGESTLRAALAQDPDDACAAEGLGLLELARGDVRGALHRMMAMIAKAYMPGAAAGVKAARKILTEEQGKQGGGGQGGEIPNDPVVHPSTPAQGGNPPGFDAPPDISTGMNLCANYEAFVKWAGRASEDVHPVIQEFSAVGVRGGMARARQRRERGVLVRSNDRERFALTALAKRVDRQVIDLLRQSQVDELSEKANAELHRRLEEIWKQKADDYTQCAPLEGEARTACYRRADAKECAARNEMVNTLYAPIYRAWRDYYEQVHKTVWEYHHFCAPWLQDIHDKDLNRELNLDHQILIFTIESNARMDLMTRLPPFLVVYCEPPPAVPPEQGVIGTWENIDPTDCRGPETGIGLGVVSLTGDCDKLELEGGEGLIGSLTYKVGGPRWFVDDELTVFAGVGAKAAGGPADISAKLGPYITVGFDKDGYPTIKDYGVRSEGEAVLPLGPVTLGGKVEARLSGESGVGVDFKPGVKVGQ